VARGFLDPRATPASFRARERGVLKMSRPFGRVDRSMADKKPPEDDLSNLRRRVAAARGEGASKNAPAQSPASLAMRFGGEFGAAIIVGALLGYGADYFLHSSPVGLVIGFGLGFAAGIVNVVRVAQSFNKANPPDPNAPSIPDDDD
ncbi:MAG: AtpZ/AtpI family protein, partial [Alphaproteobacteria bacterium]|nr:AtpZ/AtpI family protein [Alphaproteobacteria bacterium]